MDSPKLDIGANRSASKWTRREQAGRVLWAIAWPLFRCSPRLFWGWRRFLLRCFGAKVGREVQIHPSAQIFIPWNLTIGDFSSIGFDALIYNLGRVSIGQAVTISQRAHLCGGTHDYSDPQMRLLKVPIFIKDNAWICADAFVGPAVEISAGAVVGARAVVIHDVAEWTIVAGNPAREIGTRSVESND